MKRDELCPWWGDQCLTTKAEHDACTHDPCTPHRLNRQKYDRWDPTLAQTERTHPPMSDTNRRKVRLTGSRWPETGDPESFGDSYFERGQVYEIDYRPSQSSHRLYTREGKEQSYCWLEPTNMFGAELLPVDEHRHPVTEAVQGALDALEAILVEAEKALEAHNEEHKAIFDERSRLQEERRRAGIAVAQIKVTLEDLA